MKLKLAIICLTLNVYFISCLTTNTRAYSDQAIIDKMETFWQNVDGYTRTLNKLGDNVECKLKSNPNQKKTQNEMSANIQEFINCFKQFRDKKFSSFTGNNNLSNYQFDIFYPLYLAVDKLRYSISSHYRSFEDDSINKEDQECKTLMSYLPYYKSKAFSINLSDESKELEDYISANQKRRRMKKKLFRK